MIKNSLGLPKMLNRKLAKRIKIKYQGMPNKIPFQEL